MISLNLALPVHGFLRKLALAPPFLKTKFFSRVCGWLARNTGLDGSVFTNLGISSALKVRYPHADHFTQVFGVPLHYQGERGALRVMGKLLPSCGGFLDVGANVGYFTYFAAIKAKEIPVVFFEPNPELFRFVLDTAQRNNLRNVSGYSVALGATDENAPFFIDASDSSFSSLNPAAEKRYTTTTVQVQKLDSFLERRQDLSNLLVKVDVENTEYDFLEGARKSLHRIDFLILEALLPAMKKGIIRDVMEAGDFFAYYINDSKLEACGDGSPHVAIGEFNWLFCRLSPKELRKRLAGSRLEVLF